MINKGKGTYYRPGKENKEVEYIVLEYAPKGELYDYIANSGIFSEELARHCFK